MSGTKFEDLNPEVQEFFRDLREADLDLLRRSIDRQAEYEVASKLVKRVIFTIGATVAAVVTFRRDLIEFLGWFK